MAQIKSKKLRKIEPYSAAWEAKANATARSYAPEIYPCKKCNNPVVTGYCCNYCQTSEPR